MPTSYADRHPEHDRTSCSDHKIINADAEGSTGCARCTALLMDQRDEMLDVLKEAELVLAEKLRRLRADPQVSPTYRRIRAVIAKATQKQMQEPGHG